MVFLLQDSRDGELGQQVLLLPQDHLALGQAGGHIDDPLVPAAPEVELVGLLLLEEGAVHQHVRGRQQGGPVRVPLVPQVFKEIAGIGPHIEPQTVGRPGRSAQAAAWTKGSPPGEGDALDEGVLLHLLHQFLQGGLPAAGGVMGAWVVAAGAVVGGSPG